MDQSAKALVCLTTVSKEKEAKKLARELIKERLAACVQAIPKVTSFYEWDGELQSDAEILLIIKTSEEQIEPLKQFIAEHHSYEVPELVAIGITDGLPAYLEWLMQMTKD